MRLIAITKPEFWPGEGQAICGLLNSGVWRVHVRKPGASAGEMERFLSGIPEDFRPRLSLHDCFPLAMRGLAGGVHMNRRNPHIPDGFKGMVSRSCHTLEELRMSGPEYDYMFLSPIFDSISKPGYGAHFDLGMLKGCGLIDERVFALGGVTPEGFETIEAIGFGGAAMLSAAWENNPSKTFGAKTSKFR